MILAVPKGHSLQIDPPWRQGALSCADPPVGNARGNRRSVAVAQGTKANQFATSEEPARARGQIHRRTGGVLGRR